MHHFVFWSFFSTFLSLRLSDFCVVLLTNFALRHFVDDHELGDVSVSLLTVQHRFAFVYLLFSLTSAVVLLSAHLCLESAE